MENETDMVTKNMTKDEKIKLLQATNLPAARIKKVTEQKSPAQIIKEKTISKLTIEEKKRQKNRKKEKLARKSRRKNR